MAADPYVDAPKVELHLHLEGAIPLETMWALIERNGGDPSVGDLSGLRRKLAYRDFAHFIDVWTWMTNFLRTPDDFTLAAEAVARSLAGQHIVYAEASVSPTDYTRHGISVEALVAATRRGLDRVAGTRVNLIVDLVRDTGPERAMRTLEAVIPIASDHGVVGITIGGSEHDHPPAPFADVYASAARAGLRLTAHAGEAAGSDSVWSAVRDLRVERIGHGIRAVEDPALLDYLAAHQLPLEVCPTSNLRTGVAADWETHPIHRLIDAGVNVTVSTDDPTYFQSDLAGELRRVAEATGAGPLRLTLAALDAAWLEPGEAQRYRTMAETFWERHSPSLAPG